MHQNRDAFDNPITAVNLSLGTAWNAATVPSWAMLEDEFAQLEADGIFIAVSAGNSFTTYNAPGLSYPAASSHVVPVMSVDASGSLSYFSQRESRAIAAPGRSIRSTVPDYVGNQNGVTDDWASYSGTSMASPYIAGASVLIREAMEFVGYTSITENTIYDCMMSTADQVFDAATNQFYSRINVNAALDSLIPDDDFGSTLGTAFNLGTIGTDGAEISGMIGKVSDADYFRFTAAATGTVTFAADTDFYLAAAWAGDGTSSSDGTYTIDVIAGQSYSVGLSTSNGIGHFELTVTAEAALVFVDWGAVTQQRMDDLSVSGENWYCVTASQAGYLTAEAFCAGGGVQLAWYDADMQMVASGADGGGCQRVDSLVGAGEQLFLRVTGTSGDVDLRLTNLVSLDGSTLSVTGTGGDDAFQFTAGAAGGTHQLVVNGIAYQLDAAAVHSIQIDGGAGVDSITMTGTAGNETATLRVGNATLVGAGFSLVASSVEHVAVHGGGGRDNVAFYDSAGNDEFIARSDEATLQGTGYANVATDFDYAIAYSTAGGYDRARLYDSAGDDLFSSRPDRAVLQGAGFLNVASGFDFAMAYANNGGNDRAEFYDSAGNDTFTAFPDRAGMQGDGYWNVASGFDCAVAYAIAGGNDRAVFYDSAGNDTFTAFPHRVGMQGDGYWNIASGFDCTVAYAIAGGNDRAVFYDSAGNDTFTAFPDRVGMQGSGYWNIASRFECAVAYAIGGGYDQAVFYDSVGDDLFTSRPDRATLQGNGYQNIAALFEQAVAYSINGGADRAVFYDSAGDDVFTGRSDRATMQGTGYMNSASGFRHAVAYATAGGYDRADFYASPRDEAIVAAVSVARVTGDGFDNEARGFDEVVARLSNGDVAVDVEATDFVFTLVGQQPS